MVLSNKKLKKKFRDLLAESQSGAPSSDAPGEDVKQELESIKEILSSKSSKRPKRRKGPENAHDSKPSRTGEEPDKTNEVSSQSGEAKDGETKKKKKKIKKRKRDGGAFSEASVDGEEKGSEGKKQKDRRKERRKMGQEDVKSHEEENGDAITSGGEQGASELEPSNVEQSEQNDKKVYVGGIPYYSTEDDIRSFFEGCGTIAEVDCMLFPESGKFRGIAILTFKTEAAAKRALALDGADMGGFYLKIQPYKSNRTQKQDFAPEVVEGYNRIYVGNLSWDITEDDLRKFFSVCKVSSIRFGTDKTTGEFKGYAHVDFTDSGSLNAALKLDQQLVCGRPVRIRCAVPKKEDNPKSSAKPIVEKDEDSNVARSSKKKRRTCYTCGVPGHLSSSCPKKGTSSGVQK
ncbi:28 kDa ribonucleoprotein, chloroplastic [Canna indica]|uniref:28 kDa ribonucleoprotein, chloroplastic n=1 Tax=Canna indica TaxID=4628 RepID=A0AAQ3L3N6_9LILI|nr:28 kDa ribonucleoprotein, chloroplastic [Canna indica]